MSEEFIIRQSQIRDDFKEEIVLRKQTISQKIFCSGTGRGCIFITIFSIIVPILIYYFMYDRSLFKDKELYTCAVNKTYRIQCGRSNVTEDYCSNIKCCFDNSTKNCYHYLPSKYYYFNEGSNKGYKTGASLTPWITKTTERVYVGVFDLDENRAKIILSTSPIEATPGITTKKFYSIIYNETLNVEIFRDNAEMLLTTAEGPLIVSDNYLEWSFYLGKEYLFGLGETLIDLDENSTLTKVIYSNEKDHTTLPTFISYKNEKFHGLIVRHTGPLEVTVLPSNLVSLKSLIGKTLELELSIGPKLKDVLNQQRQFSYNIPKWVLSTHYCQGGPELSLENILKTYEKSKSTALYGSNCIHENLFIAILLNTDDNQITTLQTIIKDLIKSSNFILTLPPQIPIQSEFFKKSKDLGIYYKNDKNGIYKGNYLGQSVAYPDYSHSAISNFISLLKSEIETKLGVLPTNIVFANNWPAEEKYSVNIKDFTYLSEDLANAMSRTIPWNMKGEKSQHYSIHNDYGSKQVSLIEKSFSIGDDSFILTASHNLDTKKPILIQNINSTWSDLRTTIKRILYNSLFVHPFTSTPICGSTKFFDLEVQESICIRWYLMAATMPLLRISSDSPQRDPDSLKTDYAKNLAAEAIKTRNRLQAHYLTALHENIPLVRPMMYDFESDPTTFPLYSQYMVGNQILVAHPILPDVQRLWIYLPVEIKTWYEMWGGTAYRNVKDGWILFDIVETDWISFIPEGKIIPLVENTDDSVSSTLIIALSCVDNNNCEARNKLLIGEAVLEFEASVSQLVINGLAEAKNYMKCNNNGVWMIDEIRLHHPTSPKYLTPKVDLCKLENSVITFTHIY